MSVEGPQQTRPATRRERSKQRVRGRLYTSALELFTEQGYERTTIDQITERADVARGTFFNHFQRKEDLITTWAERRQDKLQSFMEESLRFTDNDVTLHLERCMVALADFNETERALTRVMLAAWVKSGQPLLEEPDDAGGMFSKIISMGQVRGEVAPGIDPIQAGNVLRDSYLGVLYRWTKTPDGKVPLQIELRALLRVVLTGILSYSQRSQRHL